MQNQARTVVKNWLFRSHFMEVGKKGIPPRTQAVFELTTKGKLKADLETLTP